MVPDKTFQSLLKSESKSEVEPKKEETKSTEEKAETKEESKPEETKSSPASVIKGRLAINNRLKKSTLKCKIWSTRVNILITDCISVTNKMYNN